MKKATKVIETTMKTIAPKQNDLMKARRYPKGAEGNQDTLSSDVLESAFSK
jgi:hypothetical protein